MKLDACRLLSIMERAINRESTFLVEFEIFAGKDAEHPEKLMVNAWRRMHHYPYFSPYKAPKPTTEIWCTTLPMIHNPGAGFRTDYASKEELMTGVVAEISYILGQLESKDTHWEKSDNLCDDTFRAAKDIMKQNSSLDEDVTEYWNENSECPKEIPVKNPLLVQTEFTVNLAEAENVVNMVLGRCTDGTNEVTVSIDKFDMEKERVEFTTQFGTSVAHHRSSMNLTFDQMCETITRGKGVWSAIKNAFQNDDNWWSKI